MRSLRAVERNDIVLPTLRADNVDRVAQFTQFTVRAHLEIPAGTDPQFARRLLENPEHSCLITNSLKAATA